MREVYPHLCYMGPVAPFQAVSYFSKKMVFREMITVFILILAVAIGFFVQTVSGFAAGLIAFPIFLFVHDLKDAVAFMSVFFLLFSVILIFKHWRSVDRGIIKELAVGIILGTILGVYFLKVSDPSLLKKLLGCFTLAYVGYSLLMRKKIEVFKKMGWLCGFVGGIFSGLLAMGGPVYVTYIYNKLEDPNLIRATIIGTMGISNSLRILLLLQNGILTPGIMKNSLLILPFFLLSIYLGQKFYVRINRKVFNNILMGLLMLSGISLIFR